MGRVCLIGSQKPCIVSSGSQFPQFPGRSRSLRGPPLGGALSAQPSQERAAFIRRIRRGEARKHRKAAQGPSPGPAECAVAHAILCTQPTELVDPLSKSPPSSSNGPCLSNRFSKAVHCELRITISSIPGAVPLAARTLVGRGFECAALTGARSLHTQDPQR